MDEGADDQSSTFKQVVAYVDQLHQDVGSMALVLEQLMEEEGFTTALGARGSWGLSNYYNRPASWRLPYLYRLYVPADRERTTFSLFYLVQLEGESIFDFPSIVCGRVTHPPVQSEDVRHEVAHDLGIRSLTYSSPHWQRLRQENGWFIAEDPDFETPVQRVQGYILNLFDMVDRRHVVDNISRPLANPDKNLDEMLTVRKYTFGGRS